MPHWKAWLCFPGAKNDWCRVVLTTTVIPASGSVTNVPVSTPADPPIDCFYLYPSVSEEYRPNSDLIVRPEERETAITQAAYFSHVCRVFAPMYHQVTAYAGETVLGFHIPQGSYKEEYTDIRAAFNDYMAHYNDGRGVVLIGHSEGSFLEEDLIDAEFKSFKKEFVGALLLGGDVQVDAQNRFDGIPACTKTGETGCIVAYSSWLTTPPASAFLQSASKGKHVLCTNPASLGGGSAALDTIFAGINPQGIVPYGSKYVRYYYVEFPKLYTGTCERASGGRGWLQVTRIKTPGDKRPTVYDATGKQRGLHPADVNMALGDLVSIVAAQSKSWVRTH